jgi:hypothetical protein
MEENRPIDDLRAPVLCTHCNACYYLEKSKHSGPCTLCNGKINSISEKHAMQLVKHALQLDRVI